MEKLSEDNWIDIFNLLRPTDIENTANSCKNWRNIITTSPSLLRKHILHIDFRDVEGMPWMKLPYKNLYMERICDKYNNKIHDFLQDINHAGVQKILIRKSNFIYSIQVLNKFPNLTTLVAKGMRGWSVQDDTKINLPNLQNLKIDNLAFGLLSKIQSHKIEVFFADLEFDYGFSQKRKKKFGRFLQNANHLKHLSLKGAYSDEILKKIKSQLETFELIHIRSFLSSSFLEFLEFQKSSLKNLRLSCFFCSSDDKIANFIYFEMKLNKFVDNRFHFGRIQELKKVSVKNLTIPFCEGENIEYFEKLFQCCKMLEVLSIKLPDKNALNFFRLLSELPNLKSLQLKISFKKWTGTYQPTFKFNRLERLILLDNFTSDQCVNIFRCCPNLTHIQTYAKLRANDFEKIFEVCNKIQEFFVLLVRKEITDDDIETFKNVGSKVKIIIATNDKKVTKKLCDAKNQLTVIAKEARRHDPFAVRPRILSDLHFDDNVDNEKDYFEEDRYS